MPRWTPLAVAALLALVPLLPLSSYLMHIFILVIMWSIIGMAWNLLGGYTGLVSFGHAAFFGLGAYSAGVVYQSLGWSGWWGLPISVVVVAIFSLVMGFVVLRLRGPYFNLSTLAIGEVLRVTAQNLDKLTQGDLGILIKQRSWTDKQNFYWVILLMALGTFYVVKALVGSRRGYYFVAIREDQDAAESLGIDTTLNKTIALTVSGVLTGLAGAFYFNYMGYIDPKVVFDLPGISILAIMIVMVGGAATQTGPLVGSLIMVLLAEWVRSLPKLGAAHMSVFGVLLILIIIFLPNGLVGDFGKIRRLFTGRRPA
jgi:branched-chain amino acid transport system permease protein